MQPVNLAGCTSASGEGVQDKAMAEMPSSAPTETIAEPIVLKRRKFGRDAVVRDFRKNKSLYALAVPVILYYFIFKYIPMYGIIIAFKDFSIVKGITRSPWIGFEYFVEFFGSFYFVRVVRNTLTINILSVVLGFPAPIVFALLINEIRVNGFKRVTQTIAYLPHFISLVVVCGIIIDFSAKDGLFNDIVELFGGERQALLSLPSYFQPMYVLSGIWQQFGWGSIIYLAALAAIDPQLYEAATIDGAGRWTKVWRITIPGIMPTIVILLILRMGQMMTSSVEKIILLYNPSIYETSDVIASYVYRKGLQEMNYAYAAAVGLFNTMINFAFLIGANWLSRRVNETSLW